METSTAVVERLATTKCVPIASLQSTETVLRNSSIKAVISLIWPYSASTRSVAVLLAEPDFRKRNNRGQVRVQFRGLAAQALITSRVEIGDTIHLSLQGAQWVEDAATIKTPGRSVDGELLFRKSLVLLVTRDSSTVSTIQIDERESPVKEHESGSTQPAASPRLATPPIEQPNQSVQTPARSDHSKLWNSPTPFRNSFGSSHRPSPDAQDPFEDPNTFEDRPSKRSRFGRTTGRWRYVESRADSPEGAAPSSSPVLSSPLVMGPPRLPKIQTDLSQSSNASIESQQLSQPTMPRSPELRPVESAVLPAISPFPFSPQSRFSSLPDAPKFSFTEEQPHELSGFNKSQTSPTVAQASATAPQLVINPEVPPVAFAAEGAGHYLVHATDDTSHGAPTSPIFDLLSPIISSPLPTAVSQSHEAPVIDLISDNEETPATAPTEPFFGISQGVPSFDHNNQTSSLDLVDGNPLLALDGAVDEPQSGSGTLTQDHNQVDLSRISTLDNSSLISASTFGRAVTQESGQLTPEMSQDTSQLQQPHPISLSHRVDDILDGRLPPTPQRSDIPASMVGPLPDIHASQSHAETDDQQKVQRPSLVTSSAVLSNEEAERHPQTRAISKNSSSLDYLAFASNSKEQSLGQRTTLSYFSPLSSLNTHLNNPSQSSDNLVDVMAVVTSPTAEPKRAKAGPRDHFTIMHVADRSVSPRTLQVQLFRPSAHFLPIADVGDVVLLRNFAVKSSEGELHLLSEASSAWCVWKYSVQANELEPDLPLWARLAHKNPNGVDEECRGRPVEIGTEERQSAHQLHSWWHSLQGQTVAESNGGVENRSAGTLRDNDSAQRDGTLLVAS